MLVRQQESILKVDSPAKLNLFLEVCKRRADRFHEIETVISAIDLHDTLLFSHDQSGKISVDCQLVFPNATSANDLPILNSSDNLVCKAAKLLQNFTGCSQGVDITIQKRIPTQAGLAGGSSNAAATLLAINQLWKLQLDHNTLQTLAAQLGSDIGFFLSTGNPTEGSLAVCTGRGEKIEPRRSRTVLDFVILKPQTGLSTAKVYQGCTVAQSPQNSDTLLDGFREGKQTQIIAGMFNALQAPAELLNNQVQQTLELLNKQPVLKAQMTGSGSACFGVCANRKHALKIAARLRANYAGEVFVARSLV